MKTIIPLCVPRSGSSTLAGVLHHLGVNMGPEEDLKIGKFSNEYGCYENQDFLSLNAKILISAGIYNRKYLKLNKNRLEKTVKEYTPLIKETIKKHEKKVWGWKTPSFHYVMPYVEEYLTNPYYIYLERDVQSVVDSNIRLVNDGVQTYQVFKQFAPLLRFQEILQVVKDWIKTFFIKGNVFNKPTPFKRFVKQSYSNIEEFLQGKEYLHVRFNNLINQPRKVVDDIIEFTNITPTEEQIRNAVSFINPELVHFKK